MTKSTTDTNVENLVSENAADENGAAPSTGQIQGRAIFSTEITAAGVAVTTAFLTEDGRVFPLPAVFPDLQYALSQIDELRQIVINQFSQAAQVGAQVIAAEMAARANAASQEEAKEDSKMAAAPGSERAKRSLQ